MNAQYKVSGKVLWIDQRDGQAIVLDTAGNQYFTESSISPELFGKSQQGQVSFELLYVAHYGLVATNAKLVA